MGTPVAMRLVVLFGPKSILVVGNLLGGLGNILLAFCWLIDQDAMFTISCFFLRILAGFAFAFQSTTAYGLLPALFGPAVSSGSGTMEGVNGLAMIMGPIVGSTLFSLGGGKDHIGYVLPFLILGGIELVFAIASLGFLPKLPVPPQQQPRLTSFTWKVLIPFAVCVTSGASLGLLNPTIEPHLEAPPLNYSVQMVGFAFAAACGAYALTAPVAGVLDDCTEARWALQMMSFGLCVTGLGFASLGPIPLDIGGQKWRLNAAACWAGACLIGVGCSFGLIPVYKQILLCATHEEQEEAELATSACFTIALSVGGFLGPTMGGMLSQAVGVRTAYFYSTVFLFALALLLLILALTPAFRNAHVDSIREPALLSLQARANTS